jgi:hypothetical protein
VEQSYSVICTHSYLPILLLSLLLLLVLVLVLVLLLLLLLLLLWCRRVTTYLLVLLPLYPIASVVIVTP